MGPVQLTKWLLMGLCILFWNAVWVESTVDLSRMNSLMKETAVEQPKVSGRKRAVSWSSRAPVTRKGRGRLDAYFHGHARAMTDTEYLSPRNSRMKRIKHIILMSHQQNQPKQSIRTKKTTLLQLPPFLIEDLIYPELSMPTVAELSRTCHYLHSLSPVPFENFHSIMDFLDSIRLANRHSDSTIHSFPNLFPRRFLKYLRRAVFKSPFDSLDIPEMYALSEALLSLNWIQEYKSFVWQLAHPPQSIMTMNHLIFRNFMVDNMAMALKYDKDDIFHWLIHTRLTSTCHHSVNYAVWDSNSFMMRKILESQFNMVTLLGGTGFIDAGAYEGLEGIARVRVELQNVTMMEAIPGDETELNDEHEEQEELNQLAQDFDLLWNDPPIDPLVDTNMKIWAGDLLAIACDTGIPLRILEIIHLYTSTANIQKNDAWWKQTTRGIMDIFHFYDKHVTDTLTQTHAVYPCIRLARYICLMNYLFNAMGEFDISQDLGIKAIQVGASSALMFRLDLLPLIHDATEFGFNSPQQSLFRNLVFPPFLPVERVQNFWWVDPTFETLEPAKTYLTMTLLGHLSEAANRGNSEAFEYVYQMAVQSGLLTDQDALDVFLSAMRCGQWNIVDLPQAEPFWEQYFWELMVHALDTKNVKTILLAFRKGCPQDQLKYKAMILERLNPKDAQVLYHLL